MNSRATLWALVILVATGTLSLLTHIATTESQKKTDTEIPELRMAAEAYDWQSVLSSMERYKEPIATPTESVQQSNDQLRPHDAKLVAIIVDSPKTAMLVIPNDPRTMPVGLQIGQGWLDGWVIGSINADAVIWQNIDDAETYTQYLFE